MVEDGAVLVISGREGRRLIVAIAGRGSLLVPPAEGEQFTAVGTARLTAVVREAHEALLLEPAAARAITDGLIDAVSDREETLANFARYPYSERVRAKLLQLARRHGRVSAAGVAIDLPLTHELIADMVGSTRETVTWAIRNLT